ADRGTLESDVGSWRRPPARWLLRFDVPRPPSPAPVVADETIAQLAAWVAAHPGRPIVGPDWQAFTLDTATDHICAEAASGHVAALEETWLDGGNALRVV